jgi:hypothetical protein
LNALKDQQKNLFFLIISRFIETLSDYYSKSDEEKKKFSPNWYKWTSERLEDILLTVNILTKSKILNFYLIIYF